MKKDEMAYRKFFIHQTESQEESVNPYDDVEHMMEDTEMKLECVVQENDIEMSQSFESMRDDFLKKHSKIVVNNRTLYRTREDDGTLATHGVLELRRMYKNIKVGGKSFVSIMLKDFELKMDLTLT